MEKSLRQRRDRAGARHESALTRFPTREGDAFTEELAGIVAELTEVAETADVRDADPVEVAKAYRWLGDAYFDLARSKDLSVLARGAAAYRRAAELLVDAEAPVEKAKLDFNSANTLRALSRGSDVGLLEAAQTRYERAQAAFRRHALPELASMVADQLETLGPQLRLVRKLKEMHRGYAKLEDLQNQLDRGASVLDRDRIAQELADLRQKPASGDAAGILDEALTALRNQVSAHSDRFEEPSSVLETLTSQVEGLKGRIAEPSAREQESAIRGQGGRSESETASVQDVADLLRRRIQEDVAAGNVTSDRGQQLDSIFGEFMKTMQGGGDDLASLAKRTQRMRELVGQVAPAVHDPSWTGPTPKPGTPAARGIRVLDPLRRYLTTESMEPMQPAEESTTGNDLLKRLFELESQLREAHDDDARATKLEDEVWLLARSVQQHARRYHMTVAVPDFPLVNRHAKPRSLFVSGGDLLVAAASALADRQGLELFARPRRGETANERWTQLSAAGVAVFDLGVPEGPERAQVCYELGLALSLGKPCVITKRPDQQLPFDVELQAIDLLGAGDFDVATLDAAVQEALAVIVWGGRSVQSREGARLALNWLERRFPHRLREGTMRIAYELAAQNQDDAVAFRGSVLRLLGMLGADAPTVLFPAWPPAYPDSETKPRCFHVMPFSEGWSNSVRDVVREACGAGWIYSRGDESEEQRIIPGIWKEISRASAVLIDVTGHNPNVALELGLVHALGRPYRVVAQGKLDESSFPSLAKVKVHSYGPTLRSFALGDFVREFLESERSV